MKRRPISSLFTRGKTNEIELFLWSAWLKAPKRVILSLSINGTLFSCPGSQTALHWPAEMSSCHSYLENVIDLRLRDGLSIEIHFKREDQGVEELVLLVETSADVAERVIRQISDDIVHSLRRHFVWG